MSSTKASPVLTKVDLKVDIYNKLIATRPEIERKGAANPHTSLNGHIFAIRHDSGSLAIRCPEDKRQGFLKKYKTVEAQRSR